MEETAGIDVQGLLCYDVDIKNSAESIHVISDPCSKKYRHSIGNGLWQAALELVEFLAGLPSGFVEGLRVLELGAGLGVVGQALQLQGAHVTLTDKAVQLPLLERNVAENFGSRADRPRVHELDWAAPELSCHPAGPVAAAYDLIIGSDVAYDEDMFQPLLSTLMAFTAGRPSTKVILALPDRPETQPFWHLAAGNGCMWRVLRRIARPELATPISIYQLLMAAPASSEARLLYIFDFDWSLVEENSDTWVLDRLGATPQFQRLKATGLPWTQLMDASLLAAHTELGRSERDVLAACRGTPLAACMRQAVLDLAALDNCDMVVLSDANTVFIDEILRHHSLLGCFQQVHSNEGVWEGGALRVRPYHQGPEPHGCPRCPANLCKGLVMERLLLQHNYARVVYLGDGSGDCCPCTRLGARDFVLARQRCPSGSPCSLLRQAERDGARVADCYAGQVGGPLAAAPEGASSAAPAGDGAIAAPGRQLRPGADWMYDAEAASRWAPGIFAATVCPWNAPAEAASLLKVLSCVAL